MSSGFRSATSISARYSSRMARKGRHQAAETRGRRAETLAALWLRLKGYRILARRVRLPVGEIDLIARKGGVLAFVEVKARADFTTAANAVTPSSWKRINRAADSWTARWPDLRALSWRFDLIVIQPRSRPVHLADQWRPDFAPSGR